MQLICCANVAAALQAVLSLIALLVVQGNSRHPVRDDRAVPFEKVLSLGDCLQQHALAPDTPKAWEARAALIHIGHSTTQGEALNCHICAAIKLRLLPSQPLGAHIRLWDMFLSGKSTPLDPLLPFLIAAPCSECLMLLPSASRPQHHVMRLTVVACFDISQ